MSADHFVISWIRAFLLLCATYNPTGWSFVSWLESRPDLPASVIFIFAVLLLIGYVLFFRQAMKSARGEGVLIIAFLFYAVAMNVEAFAADLPWFRDLSGDWLLLILISATMATAVSIRSG